MPNIAQLDKSLTTPLNEGYGTITIRVVVLEKTKVASPAPPKDDGPADAEPDEVLPETDKRPISTFLEEPKRGKQCCVFLINGQRQHAWDNQFIVRDLDMKYLRNRMIVIVDCDGLKPEATNQLMQGSRFQFLEGSVLGALESRVIATLKNDPELRQLEEEAEEEISSLQAGDEVVKAALDQLIESHHDSAAHTDFGQAQKGEDSRRDGVSGKVLQTQDVVLDSDSSVGQSAFDPVLLLRPDVMTIRLKPSEAKKVVIHARPDESWKSLETMAVTFDPPVKEMIVSREQKTLFDEITLKFAEPDGFDADEYPIESTMRATAVFKGQQEVRIMERRVVINPKKAKPEDQKQKEKKEPELLDDPTYVKVTSRLPIKIVIGTGDVHVKLKWDGKTELLTGKPPPWSLRFMCDAPTVEPKAYLTHPVDGRFTMLIQSTDDLTPGEQIKIDVEAVGPNKTLSTAFLAEIVEPPSARKISAKLPGGGQRRPPYELRYVTKEKWEAQTCWGEAWNGEEPGSFEEPSAKTPLVIFINQDMDLLAGYRDAVLTKKSAESVIQKNINKYTTHVAFHLYQMYQNRKALRDKGIDSEAQTDEQMQAETHRVARTLIKLMDMI